MSGEGAIEHPMSTHSAPFGTSWTARGWRYIASILMILTLCVGNAIIGGSTASAATYYATGRAIAVRFGGDDASYGTVGCTAQTGTTTAAVKAYTEYNTGTYSTDMTSSATVKSLTYNGWMYVCCFAKADTENGYSFVGWFTDAACTKPAPNAEGIAAGATWSNVSTQYYYKVNRQTGIPQGSNTTAQTAHVFGPFYAKFQKNSTTKNYRPQLTVTSANNRYGQTTVGTSDVTAGSVQHTEKTVSATMADSEEESVSQTFNVKAVAFRGYQFSEWTGISNLSSEDKNAAHHALTSFIVTLNKDMTPVDGYITNSDVVTANFVTETPKHFKIKKDIANAGTVTGSFTYPCATTTGQNVVNGNTKPSPMALNSMSLPETEIEGKRYRSNPADEEAGDVLFYSADIITLTATAAEKYQCSGWYARREGKPDSLLTTDPTVTTSLTEDNMTFVPIFALAKSGLLIDENDNFLVGNSTCTSLEQAISAATQGQHKTILQLQDYTVPAGNYTIPAGVTLLIPYDEDQLVPCPSVPRVGNENATSGSAYKTLTLGSDVKIDVYGTIEVSGRQATGVSGAGGEDGIGCPTGDYGCLYMGAGSSITLNDGALLRGWGFVLGYRDGQGKYQCEIDARRGSRVQEQFQIMDWKGGTYTMGMTDGINSNVANPNSYKVLPINQYYIQNVEVPVKYRPGAKLQANASVFVNGTFYGMKLNNITFNIDNVGIIGVKYNDPNVADDSAIFLMDNEDDSEDTWVRKYYDVVNDKQVYEINNAASLGSLTLNVLGVNVSSTEYKLPITSNFKIHLLYGNMTVTQHTEILPGAEIEIDKEGALAIPQNVTMYLWDSEDWGNFVSTTRVTESTFAFGRGTTVKWRPGGRPTVRRDSNGEVIIGDAKLTMHGSAYIEGYLKSTTHGTTITSTIADAGTVIFYNSTPADANAGKVWQVRSLPADGSHASGFIGVNCTSAQLTNEDGTLTSTANTVATDETPISYCFIDFDGDGDGEWKSLATDGCFVKDEDDVYYIKPQEYVAISQSAAPVEEADHTYRDHYAGTNRIFILAAGGDCQWWEVQAVSGEQGLFECINENNHTFFYYDETAGNWLEKKFKVSWVNWDGSPVNYTNSENEQVNYYMVTYGTVPTWKSNNPTRAADASHEYTFDGWMPTPAAVTKDVTYMATFKERDRMYAITFNDESDELIQLLYCKLGDIPACTKYDAEANGKEWKTATGEQPLGAVSKDEVYKLFTKDVTGPFTIRFVNWNGEELQSGSVAKDATPTYNAAANGTPSKPADNSHSYVFVGWTPAIAPATQNMTYTAKYEVEQISGLNVNTASTLTSDMTVPEVRITTTGSLNITSTAVLTTTNLILEATSNASGQLDALANSNIVTVNAYFDWKPNGETGTANRTWYAIAVPWEVDAKNGIFLKETGRHLVIGQDFDLIYYSGSERASVGNKPSCWKYVQHDANKTMRPGQLYMMYFDPGFKTIRFVKKAGSAVLYTGTVSVSEFGASDDKDANWNGIANPKTYYASLSLSAGSATYAQVLNNGSLDDYFGNSENPVYKTISLGESSFSVGKPLFIQPTQATTIIVDKSENATITPASAPRRVRVKNLPKGIAAVYCLAIAGEDQPEADNLFVQVAEDEKADRYTIGQDLVKGGVASGRAQVWVNRYDAKLSVNTQALSENEATYPLTIQIPSNGEYTLSIGAVENEEYALYLTRNGEAIWNLSDGAYTGAFEKGTTSEYGLRVSARAPQITTGIDEAVVDAKGETRKVLINNTVYIIRGENVYSVDGQLVK